MSLKIFFMGTPDFALPILKTLYQSSHKIMGVYTQPPKKKIVGKKLAYLVYTNIQRKIIFLSGSQKH